MRASYLFLAFRWRSAVAFSACAAQETSRARRLDRTAPVEAASEIATRSNQQKKRQRVSSSPLAHFLVGELPTARRRTPAGGKDRLRQTLGFVADCFAALSLPKYAKRENVKIVYTYTCTRDASRAFCDYPCSLCRSKKMCRLHAAPDRNTTCRAPCEKKRRTASVRLQCLRLRERERNRETDRGKQRLRDPRGPSAAEHSPATKLLRRWPANPHTGTSHEKTRTTAAGTCTYSTRRTAGEERSSDSHTRTHLSSFVRCNTEPIGARARSHSQTAHRDKTSHAPHAPASHAYTRAFHSPQTRDI